MPREVFIIFFIVLLSFLYILIVRFGYIRGFNKGHYKGYQEGFDMAVTSLCNEEARNQKEKKDKRKLAIQKATYLKVVREKDGNSD